ATTGPASGPRPTSSTPAINGPTVRRSSRSIGVHRSRPMGPAGSLLGRRGARLRDGDARLLLANTRRLAGEIAEVVELGATDAPAAQDDDLGEHRAMHGEDALDADTVRDLADGERLADPGAAAGDADALERLDALL